jgi:DNA/RNA endonuclease YhcR with UshA esterase domain
LRKKTKEPVKIVAKSDKKASNSKMSFKKIYFPTLALLAFAMRLSADPTNNSALAKIGTLEATNFYGKEMIVTGKVAQVSVRPGIVFLNMDKPYPASPFTLVILPAATNQFDNLKLLKGASVEATGKVTNYHGKPEIVLEKSNQLTITSVAPTNAPSSQ